MKRWVVKVNDYVGAYWEMLEDGSKRSTDIRHCDKFRFWVFACLFYINQIAYGSKIVKIEVKK